MKLFYHFFLRIILFCIICPTNGIAKFNQASFDSYAAEYGYKAANLNELTKILPSLNSKMPGRYKVPAFFPISNKEVQEFLSKSMMPDKSSTVMEFINKQLEKFKQIQLSIGGNALTPEAIKVLETIENIIEKSLDEQQFSFYNSEREKQFDQFLKEAAEQNNLLMVRSTGKEDTKELANAGGNKSIAAVKPDIRSVSKAMGEVAASYFGKKSISQRLVANDKTIFDKPFMPILPQVMIGKNPVSGVMFSEEAEGHTPGVTHIQATYGHGEGVVNGLVPVDTFYVGPTMLVHPLIRIKDYRLTPSTDFSHLERIANSAKMANNPCLSADIIRDLKTGADIIQQYYGYPVDIEFVVENDIIYLVQARPIVSKDRWPSYLKDEFVATSVEKFPIFTIITAGGAVRIITEAQAVILTDNIRVALDTFLDPKTNKDLVQAVISGELAPATSHEGTTFRGADKAVVYLQNLDQIRSWITEKKFPFFIDVQRGIIVSFKPSDLFKSVNDAIVKNAWFAHPIPKKTSLFPQFIQIKDVKEIKPQELMPGKKTSQLIAIIKNGAFADAVNALKSILARISQAIVIEQKKSKGVNPQIIAQLKNVFAHAISSAQEVLLGLQTWEQSPKTQKDRLARLYPIIFFEAIISQVPMPKEFVNDYSFISVLKTELIEQKIIKELALGPSTAREYMVQYAKTSEYALSTGLRNQWDAYIKTIETLPQNQQQKFARMMYDLAQDKVLPLWFNVSFVQAQSKAANNPLKISELLLEEFDQASSFISQLRIIQENLNAISLNNWANPELFEKQWNEFEKNLLMPITSQQFNKNYEQSPLLGKLVAVAFLNNLVNQFDLSIKTLKSSSEYKNKHLQSVRFRTMIGGYLQILEKLMRIPSIENDLLELLDSRTFRTLNEYLVAIKNILYGIQAGEAQMQPSPGFNVAAATLGSKALWERSIGNAPTYEDIFSLIHQNLLVVLRTLNKKTNIEQILQVPDLVQKVKKAALDLKFSALDPLMQRPIEVKTFLIGVSLETDYLIYYFNMPLRNHSCTFQIIFDNRNKITSLAVQFVGQARERFSRMADLIYLFTSLYGISIDQAPSLDEQRGKLEFTLKIMRESQIPIIFSFLNDMIRETFLVPLVLQWAIDLTKPLSSADLENEINKLLQVIFSKNLRSRIIIDFFTLLAENNRNKLSNEQLNIIIQKFLNSPATDHVIIGLGLISNLFIKPDSKLSEDTIKKFFTYVLKGINGKEDRLQNAAYDLLNKILITGNLTKETAIITDSQATKLTSLRKDPDFIRGMRLFANLLAPKNSEKLKSFELYEKIADQTNAILKEVSNRAEFQMALLDFYKETVKDGVLIPEAIEFANNVVLTGGLRIKSLASLLFEAIIKSDYITSKKLKEIADISFNHARSSDSFIVSLGTELLDRLLTDYSEKVKSLDLFDYIKDLKEKALKI